MKIILRAQGLIDAPIPFSVHYLAAYGPMLALPMFFYLYDVTIIVGFLLGLLAGAITFTWLYNSTGGSILMVAVWHGAFNFTTGCIACKTGATAAILSTLVIVWAVVVVVWMRSLTMEGQIADEPYSRAR